MACTLNLEESEFEKVHKQTYSIVKQEVSDETYVELTSGKYRETMKLNSEAFKEQIPYYSIRIL